MRIPWILSCATALVAIAASGASAATITVKDTETLDVSGFDRWRSASSVQSGTSTWAAAGLGTDFVSGSNYVLRAPGYFSLDSIPAGSTINSVELKVWAKQNDTSGNVTPTDFPNGLDTVLELHELTNSFVNNESSWDLRSTGVPWTNPGGDYSPTVLSSIDVNPTTFVDNSLYADPNEPALLSDYTFGSGIDFVSAIQNASDNASDRTFYFVLKLPDNVEQGARPRVQFQMVHDNLVTSTTSGSNRNTAPEMYPELIINYTVPEPSGVLLFSLLAMSATALRSRRS